MSDVKLLPDVFSMGNEVYELIKKSTRVIELKINVIQTNKKMYRQIIANYRYLWLLLVHLRAIMRPNFGHTKKRLAKFEQIRNTYEPLIKESRDRLEQIEDIVSKENPDPKSELLYQIATCEDMFNDYMDDFNDMIYLL